MIAIGAPLLTLSAYGQKLNPQPNGQVTVSVLASCGLKREDGSPAQDGDVLSVQPDGLYQVRPAGTAGPYELATVSGNNLIYAPGAVYVVPVVQG